MAADHAVQWRRRVDLKGRGQQGGGGWEEAGWRGQLPLKVLQSRAPERPLGANWFPSVGRGGSEWDGEEEDQGGQDLVGPRLVSAVESRPSRQRTKSFSGF